MQTFNSWDFSSAFTSPRSWLKFVCATSSLLGIEFSACSFLLLKICAVWENMPRSDFSWPSANSNKLFRELEQLHWGNVKNISWHTLTSSIDWSSLCENKDLSVSHFYSLWFFRVVLLWGISILYSCQQNQGHPSTDAAAAYQPLARLLWAAGEEPPDGTGSGRAGRMNCSCKAESWACVKEKK